VPRFPGRRIVNERLNNALPKLSLMLPIACRRLKTARYRLSCRRARYRRHTCPGRSVKETEPSERIIEKESPVQSRMKNPAVVLSDAMQPIQAVFKAAHTGGVEAETLELVHLRVSQINGCSACVDAGAKTARKAGVSEERLATVAAWRETPYFTDAERAALALAEAATRLADRPDPVSDEVWDAAAGHFDEKGMAAIVLMIGVTNMFNRLNASTRQIAGAWG